MSSSNATGTSTVFGQSDQQLADPVREYTFLSDDLVNGPPGDHSNRVSDNGGSSESSETGESE